MELHGRWEIVRQYRLIYTCINLRKYFKFPGVTCRRRTLMLIILISMVVIVRRRTLINKERPLIIMRKDMRHTRVKMAPFLKRSILRQVLRPLIYRKIRGQVSQIKVTLRAIITKNALILTTTLVYIRIES